MPCTIPPGETSLAVKLIFASLSGCPGIWMTALAESGKGNDLLREFLTTTFSRMPLGVGVKPCSSKTTEALELSLLLGSATELFKSVRLSPENAEDALVEFVGSKARLCACPCSPVPVEVVVLNVVLVAFVGS